MREPTSVYWALTGVFAAFHLVVSLVPYSIVLGASGVISFGLISGPLIGFLLGPIYGPIAVLLGSFLAITIDPALMVIGPFTPLATGAGALAAGALRSGRALPILAIYICALLAFVLGPLGNIAPLFLIPHALSLTIVGILAATRVSERASKMMMLEPDAPSTVMSVLAVAFASVMLDNAIGNSIASYYFVYAVGADPVTMAGYFLSALFIYPIERSIAALLITPLYVAVRTAMIQTNLDFLPESSSEEEKQPTETKG
ncbi:hypothetical protein EU546_06200 [Candidatus Thorarchaeota archaeon]|nr:MAG: hypothetical protein EU546_06200 [Candidatus Thorarchaeota archaeon]